jgi:lipase
VTRLHARSWDGSGAQPVVCVHGVTQDGAVFEPLAARLSERGHAVAAVDLRGHGASQREPPWDIGTHVDDLLATADALGITRAAWVGHSFGGRLVATLAARAPERVDRLALLEPGLHVPPERALRQAEIDRLDWSFETVDGAVNALMSSEAIVAAPREVVAAYVRADVRQGRDGLLRFGFCPSAAVVAWSEMALPPPPIATVPTLIVRAATPLVTGAADDSRYQATLGSLATLATVPNGHNVLWESPAETIAVVERFLSSRPD